MPSPEQKQRVPMYPDMSRPVTFGFEFRTSVFESRYGRETRTAQTPFPFRDMVFREVEMFGRYWKSSDSTAGKKTDHYVVPDLFRSVDCQVSSGSVLVGDFSDRRFREGTIFLMGVDGVRSYTVADYQHDEIRVEEGIPKPHQVRVAFPPCTAYPEPTRSLKYETSGSSSSSVFVKTGLDFGAMAEVPVWSPTHRFRSAALALFKPNFLDRVERTLLGDFDVLDTKFSNPKLIPKPKTPRFVTAYTHLIQSSDVLQFFLAMRGRMGFFYAPTWLADIVSETPMNAGDSFVQLHDPAGVFDASVLEDHPGLFFRYGEEHHCATITGYDTGGDAVSIRFDPPLPEWVSGLRQASFIWPHRFASDRIEVERFTSKVNRTEVSMQTTFPECPPVSFGNKLVRFGGKTITAACPSLDTTTIRLGGMVVQTAGRRLLWG